MATRTIASEAYSAPLRIRIGSWGEFSLGDQATGADLKPRGRKARALLAYLAHHPGKPIGRERLAGLLWAERGDEQARLSLRQTLHELKPFRMGRDALLLVDSETVTLDGDGIVSDIAEWEALAEERRFDTLLRELPDPDESFLASFDGIDPGFDDWLAIERGRQDARLDRLIEEAAAAALRSGNEAAADRLRQRLAERHGEDRVVRSNSLSVAAPFPPETPGTGGNRDRNRTIAALLSLGLVAAAGAFAYPSVRSSLSPVATASETTQARRLVAVAQGLVYRREGPAIRVAEDLFRQAAAIDPESADALAGIAQVTAMRRRDPAGFIEAERLVRRAIRLQPDSARAQAVLGMVLNFSGAEAGAALERASRIAPRDAEIRYWLSNHYGNELRFGDQYATLRQAVASDPNWPLAVNQLALLSFELGNRAQAVELMNRLEQLDPQLFRRCQYGLDFASGNFARVVRRNLARPTGPTGADDNGDEKLGFALLALGYADPARLLLKLSDAEQALVFGRELPTEEARRIFQSRNDDYMPSMLATVIRQRLLREGRPAEVLALYEGSDELTGRVVRSSFFEAAPDLILAMRAVGRHAAADRLAREAMVSAQRVSAGGAVTNSFAFELARLAAVSGREDAAVATLGQAVARGWRYFPLTARSDIADIPAFATLRGREDFERVRGRLLAELAEQRREIRPLLAEHWSI